MSKPLDHCLSLLGEKDSKTRLEAIRALGEMGPEAEAAIPALAELLQDDRCEVWTAVTTALCNIGSAAIPVLIGLLRDKEAKVRDAARYSLIAMRLNAESAIPLLTELFRDKEKESRIAAA